MSPATQSKLEKIDSSVAVNLVHKALAAIGTAIMIGIVTIGVNWMSSISASVERNSLATERLLVSVDGLAFRIGSVEGNRFTASDGARLEAEIDRLNRLWEQSQ